MSRETLPYMTDEQFAHRWIETLLRSSQELRVEKIREILK